MRYLIAIPCMDMVHTLFMSSLLAMPRPEGSEFAICSSSLVYDSRNRLAMKAVNEGFDRVLWLDSDMVFDTDLMTRLIADMDEGRQCVCGLYFTRKAPVMPCIYKALTQDGAETKADSYEDYPRDSVFEIAACGFGAVMMDAAIIRNAGNYGRPFSPIDGWGEDLSFALRMRNAGVRMWCDSRIRVSHLGLSLINEQTWEGR